MDRRLIGRSSATALCALVLISAVAAFKSGTTVSDTLDVALKALVREQNVSGLAVGIVRDGELTYAGTFGVMRVSQPEAAITPETLFHMASITKPFVMTAV